MRGFFRALLCGFLVAIATGVLVVGVCAIVDDLLAFAAVFFWPFFSLAAGVTAFVLALPSTKE